MSQGLLAFDPTACLLCGATHANKRKGTIGHCCDACWDRFIRSQPSGVRVSELEFNRWLSRQVVLTANRFEKFGTSARCEAATLGYLDRDKDHHIQANGYQCRHWATGKRDGKNVCGLHAKVTEVTFVGTAKHSAYDVLQATLVHCAKADPLFADMLRRAADAQ